MIFKIILGVIITVFLGAVIFSVGLREQRSGSTQRIAYDALIGQPAPDFKLTSLDGKRYQLSELRGKKVLLFFNEGLMCYPACWNQIAALGTDDRLKRNDLVALSVVTDGREGWDEAIARMPELGKGTILLDTGATVSRTYDTLLLPSSMHRGSMPGHTFILVDEKGVVRYTYDDPKMGQRNDKLVEAINNMEGKS